MVRCKKMEENMKRPNIFFILGCLFFLFIVACDKISAPGPKDILNKYLNASLKGRYEEAYNHISSADKSIRSISLKLFFKTTVSSFLTRTLGSLHSTFN